MPGKLMAGCCGLMGFSEFFESNSPALEMQVIGFVTTTLGNVNVTEGMEGTANMLGHM
jgi:hypothetical protein